MSKNILKELEEHLEWLKTPEGKQYSIEYVKQIKEKKQSKIDYVGSEEFNKTYQIIYDWVKKYERIDDIDIHYKFNPGIELENEEWNKFTDAIAEKFDDNKIFDDESSFPKYHYEYKALDVYFMHGPDNIMMFLIKTHPQENNGKYCQFLKLCKFFQNYIGKTFEITQDEYNHIHPELVESVQKVINRTINREDLREILLNNMLS